MRDTIRPESLKHRYVAGFLFDTDHRPGHRELTRVALIRKSKPEWQAGLLNGIGGKIEGEEAPEDAMAREFREEAGLAIPKDHWKYYAVLGGDDWSVSFFACYGNVDALRTLTDEVIEIELLRDITPLRKDMIENLPWLIALALDYLQDGRPMFANITYPK